MYFELHCNASTAHGSQSTAISTDRSWIVTDDKILAAEVESEIIAYANKTLIDEKSKKNFIGKYDRYSNDIICSVEFSYFSRELKSIICSKTSEKGYVLAAITKELSAECFHFVKQN